MADATNNLNVNINGNAQGLNNALNQSQKKLNHFGNFLKKVGTVATGIFAYQLFSGFVTGISNAVKASADYEKQLDKVQAITGASNAKMDELQDNFNKVANESKFAGVEIGKLAETLGRRGFNADQIIDMTAAIRDLAIVADKELAETGGIIGTVLQSFQLESEKASDAANILAEAVTSTNLEINTFGVGIAYVGSVAESLGYSLSETAAMMGVIANSGVKASTAGRGLRKIFIELNARGISLSSALKQVSNSTNAVDTATALVGKNFANQLVTLSQNEELIKRLTDRYDDANRSLERQALIIGSNLTTAWQTLTSKVQNYFENTDFTMLRSVINLMNDTIEALKEEDSTLDELIKKKKEDALTTEYASKSNAELQSELADLTTVAESLQFAIASYEQELHPLDVAWNKILGEQPKDVQKLNKELTDTEDRVNAIKKALDKFKEGSVQEQVTKGLEKATYTDEDFDFNLLGDISLFNWERFESDVTKMGKVAEEASKEIEKKLWKSYDENTEFGIAEGINAAAEATEQAMANYASKMNVISAQMDTVHEMLAASFSVGFQGIRNAIAGESQSLISTMAQALGDVMIAAGTRMISAGLMFYANALFWKASTGGIPNPMSISNKKDANKAIMTGLALGGMGAGIGGLGDLGNKRFNRKQQRDNEMTKMSQQNNMDGFAGMVANETRWVIRGNDIVNVTGRENTRKKRTGLNPKG